MSNISVTAARAIGARKAAAGFLWMFILTEGLSLFVNTRDDFSRGIRVFLQGQADRLFVGTVVVVLCAVILLGRLAGKQILVDRRNHMVVAMMYAGITLLASMVYIWLCAHFSRIYIEDWSSFTTIIALICGCIWLIAVRGIRRALG